MRPSQILVPLALVAGAGLLACTPAECQNGATQQGNCGLNNRGKVDQTCTNAAWVDTGTCVDPDVCKDGDLAATTSPCGFYGTHALKCVGGQFGSTYSNCTAPQNLTIPVVGRKDVMPDMKRKRVYITTSGIATGGEVKVYNLMTRQFETSLHTGGQYFGMDLAPNGDELLVADGAGNGSTDWIWKIDLTTGNATKITFTAGLGEAGTYSVAYTTQTEALVTARQSGSGAVPLRKVDLTAGTGVELRTIGQDSMLAPSADRTVIGFESSNGSNGGWGRYRVSDGNFLDAATGWFLFEIGTNRNGTQYAVPTYNGTYISDGALVGLRTMGVYAGTQPNAAAYSPVADEIYFAWVNSTVSIDVYDTTTYQKLRTVEARTGLFDYTGNHGFDNGHMRISSDGTLLFVTSGSNVLGYVVSGQ